MRPSFASHALNSANPCEGFASLRVRLRILALALAATMGLALSATSALGQATGSQGYVTSVGNVQFSTNLPVEMGNINVANGDVHLEIPLGVWPQRGRKPFVASLSYDSRIWQPWNDLGSIIWAANNVGYYAMWEAGGWQYYTNLGTGETGGYSSTRYNCVGGDPGQHYSKYFNFLWIDPSGASHTFPINTEYDPDGCDYNNPTDEEYATDSSGYLMSVTSYTTVSAVYGPDGSQIYPSYEDTNGNEINSTDTLGRTPVTITYSCNSNSNQICFNVLNSQGSRSTYTVTTESISVHTAFGQSGVTEDSGSLTVVQSIELPDGSEYSFSYDSGSSSGHYGELTGITLNTGGTVSYAYTNFTDIYGNTNQWVNTRTSGGGTWTYAPHTESSCPSGFSYCQQVTVTKPSSDNIVYLFGLNTGNYGSWLSSASYYNGSVSTSNLIQTTTATWTTGANYTQQLSQTTTWDTGVNQTVQYQYGSSYYNGDVTKISEWNFYTGSLPSNPNRITNMTYASFAHLSNITGTNGSGTMFAKTLINYDNYGSGMTSVTGTVNHDDTNYPASNTSRGNPTSFQKLVSGTSTYLTTSTLRLNRSNQICHRSQRQCDLNELFR
jgi:hypothetical protein